MNQLPHDDITPFNDPSRSKKQQVAEMFDRIAGKYDFMNRFLSARTDLRWRRKAIQMMKKENPQLIIDIATGTADMAIMAQKMMPTTSIRGIDISKEMLAIGQKKIEKEGLGDKIQLQPGDSETINFPAGTFDAGMVAFGIRNFENLEKGLSEILRVLKPGAQLIILEFSTPKNKAVRAFYNLHMKLIAPQAAKFFGQSKEAYDYLRESANAFPDRQRLVNILNTLGFRDAGFKSLSLGICCIYSGRKP